MYDNNLQGIWAIELDLLQKIKSICADYNLEYCAACGTLLGAIRHKGFIPWDDDIDIFLKWSDYKKLLEIAPKECRYPYYFQSIYTDINAMPSACRLRRSDTTGFTKWEYDNMPPEYNRGIFIDIFPLFNVPDSESDRVEQKRNVIHLWECIHGFDAIQQQNRGGYVNPDYEKLIPVYEEYCNNCSQSVNITELKEKYLEACASTSLNTREVGATSSKCHQPKLMWNSEWFDEYVDLPFENTTIRCPIAYEKILEKQYGDWWITVKNGAMHEMVIVDVERSWKDYKMDELCRRPL